MDEHLLRYWSMLYRFEPHPKLLENNWWPEENRKESFQIVFHHWDEPVFETVRKEFQMDCYDLCCCPWRWNEKWNEFSQDSFFQSNLNQRTKFISRLKKPIDNGENTINCRSTNVQFARQFLDRLTQFLTFFVDIGQRLFDDFAENTQSGARRKCIVE